MAPKGGKKERSRESRKRRPLEAKSQGGKVLPKVNLPKGPKNFLGPPNEERNFLKKARWKCPRVPPLGKLVE